MNFQYNFGTVMAILISSLLGFFVSLSTFLFIGVTSSLTYNIVGHIKTVIILIGSFAVFHDNLNSKRFIGILITLSGIVYYTYLKSIPVSNGKLSVSRGNSSNLNRSHSSRKVLNIERQSSLESKQ